MKSARDALGAHRSREMPHAIGCSVARGMVVLLARYGDAGERLSPWVGLGCMFMGVVILVS